MSNKSSEILVSIIVPIYNVEEYLDKCIKSLVKQTYKNIEILLIDDGATDNSGIICDKWHDEDVRIHVYHIENSGVSFARNLGLREAKGEYISFVDPDDYVEENFIEVLLNLIVNNECDMAIINLIEKYPNGYEKKLGYRTENKLLNRQDFLNHLCEKNSYKSGPCNKIYSRKVIVENNIFFDEGIYYGEDLYFIAQFAEKCNRFYYDFDEYLYCYYCREESATRTTFNYKTATFIKACDELIRIFTENNVDSGIIKNKYIFYYFFSLYCLEDKDNYSKQEYKKICKKYMKDVLKSKKVLFSEKVTILGIVYLPKTMKFLRDIKLFIRRNKK